MRYFWIGTALAALLVLGAGCPKSPSWEIVEEALAPGSDLDKADVHRELQRGLKRANEEIGEDPKGVRSYVTKASIQHMNGDHVGAVDTLQTALERGKPANEAENENLKLYMMDAFLKAGTPEMLKKGIRFVEDLIKKESRKNVYCYHMGVYYRRLYRILGDGVYKTEANRWFLSCTELDPEIIAELKGEGLYDPFLD
ncbi:MAG: hypothetical protein ACYTHM_00165 [Planctomycetota bacterium]|jgi:hypothetical protein